MIAHTQNGGVVSVVVIDIAKCVTHDQGVYMFLRNYAVCAFQAHICTVCTIFGPMWPIWPKATPRRGEAFKRANAVKRLDEGEEDDSLIIMQMRVLCLNGNCATTRTQFMPRTIVCIMYT